ncbi:hypothetical protein T492DRAFT_1006977, partial [Pavlovales sp. CCMP2436]
VTLIDLAGAALEKAEGVRNFLVRIRANKRKFDQWEPDEALWQGNYEQLKTFNAANPGLRCCVKEDHPLERFVRNQREMNSAGKLTPEHRELLDSLNFNFSPKAWDNRARPASSHTCRCGKLWTGADATKAKSSFR